MLKNIDSFYYIGKSHEVCDDFSLVHKYSVGDEQYTLAMVADGCSSSKNSSIGARFLLTEIATKFELMFTDINFNVEIVKDILDISIKSIHCKKYLYDIYGDYFLDCTLLISLTSTTTTRVFVIGDGTLILKYKTCFVESQTFDFENNMPFYLSYSVDENRFDEYRRQVRFFGIANQKGVYETHTFSNFLIQEYKFEHNLVSSLILCTDGISSFKSSNESISTQELCSKLIDIKNDKGVFLQRRAKRIIEEYAKLGIYHQDDFSCVALLFED